MLLTVQQVAEQLNLSASAVYELVSRRRLRALRLGPRGGAIRIRPEDIEEYLAACQSESAAPRRSTTAALKLKHIQIQL